MPKLFSSESVRVHISKCDVRISVYSRILGNEKKKVSFAHALGDHTKKIDSDDAYYLAFKDVFKKAQPRGQRTAIYLANNLARYFLASPPSNAAIIQDCVHAAQIRAIELYGEFESTWSLQGDWRLNSNFLVCALSSSILNQIKRATVDSGLVVTEIVPSFISVWNQVCPLLNDGDWLVFFDHDQLVVCACHEKKIANIRNVPTISGSKLQSDWLSTLIANTSIQFDLLPKVLHIVGIPIESVTLPYEVKSHQWRLSGHDDQQDAVNYVST